MKRILLSLVFLISLLPLIRPSSNPVEATPPPPPADETAQVEQAIQDALSAHRDNLLGAMLFKTEIEKLTLSTGGDFATAWLVPLDPDTGEPVPAEPGLTVVKKDGEDWQAILPNDPAWRAAVEEIPESLLPREEKQHWLEMYSEERLSLQVSTQTGYQLPFAAGTRLVLTRSITHHNPPDPNGNMHYSFDFAAYHDSSGKSPMFPVYASKAGKVKYIRWTQENGSEASPGNYIVLEDTTTTPVTYQLYLHLAKDSIPPALRTAGVPVLQGQYLGMADDTGASTGNHLHFQVQVPIYTNSYWGKSIDITFSDVSINGGRPRTVGEARYYSQFGAQGQTDYISGNTVRLGPTPPQGGFLEPVSGATVASSSLHLKGWAADDDASISSVQFLALYNGAWHEVGAPLSSSPFEMDWDLCDSGVPDGPVSLALRLGDTAGSQTAGLTGLRHFTKNFACPPPPPVCTPSADQAALYAGVDFKGACRVFDIGNYTSAAAFGSLGDNGAASLQVGANVQATLFMNNNNQGRGQTFTAGPNEIIIDGNLADDWIGAGTVSSLKVEKRDETPPNTPIPTYPANNSSFPAASLISLAWDNGGGAREYQVELNGQEKDWQSIPYLHLSSLAQGTYNWRVRARNGQGASGWTTTRTLIISSPAAAPLTQVTAPFEDLMEPGSSGWTFSGAWGLTGDERHSLVSSWRYTTDGTSYDNGAANSGALTSPAISLPASQNYSLSFWYLYETEGPGLHWDQRWVQLSIDGGPFTNALQLSNDLPNRWLQSPAIDLSAYAGHTLQVRFYFNTLDANANNFKGWYIDDVSITAAPTPDCSQADLADDQPVQGQAMGYNQEVTGGICRRGDVDFYQFSGQAGDRIGIYVKPHPAGSTLIPRLSLFDLDGTSLLASSSEAQSSEPGGVHLIYQLERSGVYYIKISAWDHPSTGGSDASYWLGLYSDRDQPSASFNYPQNGKLVVNDPITLSVAAQDSGSGISHVEFLWHADDWQGSDWIQLGADWDGGDGWSYPFDLRQIPAQNGFAFYARVFDRAGNWIGTGVWELGKGASKNFIPVLYR